MIRSGKWKFWAEFNHGEESGCALFDLVSDPGEKRDLSRQADYADVVNHMRARLLEDWDPRFVCQESKRLSTYRKMLNAWGRVVRPESPDMLTVPPSEYESNFVKK